MGGHSTGASLRAPSFVFERKEGGSRVWPRVLNRRSLSRFYLRAEQGLGVHQLGFEEVAKRGGTWAQRMNGLGYRVEPMRQATTGTQSHLSAWVGCNFVCSYAEARTISVNQTRRFTK